MMTPVQIKLDFGLNGKSQSVDWSAVPGMLPSSDNRWHWALKDRSAAVTAEPDGTLHVEFRLAGIPSVPAATELNGRLPGNLRFAYRGRETLLLADTIIDGQGHLRQTFAALATGILLAAEERPTPATTSGIAEQQVEDAIRAVEWGDEHVVQIADGWELRPRIRGCAVPIKATVDGDELRLHRTIINRTSATSVEHVIGEQTLRYNAQLKHARLAFRDEVWCAETRLHGEQLTPAWLEHAARAVAVAHRISTDILTVLSDNEELAVQHLEQIG